MGRLDPPGVWFDREVSTQGPDHPGQPGDHHRDSHADSHSELPLDSDLVDVEAESDVEVGEPATGATGRTIAPATSLHLRWHYLGIVAIGGTVGTALRELLSLVVPDLDGVALVILGINVLGAFLLGTLLEALSRRGSDVGRRRRLRLLFGTGVLGGFTTYSTLATGTALLLVNGRPLAAVLYALATVVIGAAATFTGIAVASKVHQHRERRMLEATRGAVTE
ncbi:hypothetical protein BH09ACT6_BH09ACT6_26820 [soil metagenome]